MTDAPHGPGRKLRVFLCHSSEDKAAVRDLYRRLREDGYEPWLDEEELVPGQNWAEEIRKAVHQCDAFLVCLSRTSISKEGYLQKELKYGLDFAGEKPQGTIFIIPVRLDPCEIPTQLSDYHYADLFDSNGYASLLRSLALRARGLQGVRGSSPSPCAIRLRSEKATLSANQAKIMVATRDFYCAAWNEGGKGIRHQFEVKVMANELLVIDHATGLAWQKGGSGQPVSGGYRGAEEYVGNLNANQVAAYSDWRLPTLEEAMSLMTAGEDRTRENAMLGSEPVQGVMHLDRVFEKGGAPFIWTADAQSESRAWLVYFWDGACRSESLAFNAYVRAVRSFNP